MTNEAMTAAQWFVHELTLVAPKASVPDGEQEDAIKAAPHSLTLIHSLTHLACARPAPRQHLFEQSELSVKERGRSRRRR